MKYFSNFSISYRVGGFSMVRCSSLDSRRADVSRCSSNFVYVQAVPIKGEALKQIFLQFIPASVVLI
jgi:hypothetical protein